jgi:hypothetical protein
MRQNLNSAPVCRSARPRSSRAKSSRRARTRSGRLGCNRIELQKNALKTLESLRSALPEGFEPLTSAVQARARLTGSSFPFLRGSSATSATAGAGLRATPVPARRRQRLERLAGLDENRLVAGRGLKASHDHVDVERIELDAAADTTGLIGRDEGRSSTPARLLPLSRLPGRRLKRSSHRRLISLQVDAMGRVGMSQARDRLRCFIPERQVRGRFLGRFGDVCGR